MSIRLLSRIKEDNAFSLDQTIIGLLISLVVITSIWNIGVMIIRSIEKNTKNITEQATIEKLDRELRKSIKMVYYPFWTNTSSINLQENQITIPWVNGNIENVLNISHSYKSLIINYNDITSEYPNISRLSIERLNTTDNLTAGIIFSYEYNGKEYSTKALFGSWPLMDNGK